MLRFLDKIIAPWRKKHNNATIAHHLSQLVDPLTHAPIGSLGLIEHVVVLRDKVQVILSVAPDTVVARTPLVAACEALIAEKTKLSAQVMITAHHRVKTPNEAAASTPQPRPQPQPSSPVARQATRAKLDLTPLAGARHVVAVASGKGGVGKSTTTVQLALALQAEGLQVGILDADIYGPSIPKMMGLEAAGQPKITDQGMQPHLAGGIQTMSMGYITGDQAAVLRAPMITKALQQMLRGVAWGNMSNPLDILLIDMPPGTGDITISLAQSCPLDGVVIVTTPQEIAVIDAKKCLLAFEKLGVSVLGVVENMSGIQAADGTLQHIFGKDGGKQLAASAQVPFLGEVALHPDIAAACDAGVVNSTVASPRGAFSQYTAIAKHLRKTLAR